MPEQEQWLDTDGDRNTGTVPAIRKELDVTFLASVCEKENKMNSNLHWHSFTLTMRMLDAKKRQHKRKITIMTSYSVFLIGVTLHNDTWSNWPSNKLLRIRYVLNSVLLNHCHQSRLPTFLPRTTRCCQSLIALNQARFPQGEITSCRDNANPPPNPQAFLLAHCFQMLSVITIHSAN